MQVISYTNGDAEITDYPTCTARPLARLVQRLNDRLAGDDGYLAVYVWMLMPSRCSCPSVCYREAAACAIRDPTS